MTTATALPVEIEHLDLVDPATFVAHDLDALWATVRNRAPVFHHPARHGRPGFWVLSRYADVLAVYRDDTHFTSEAGTVLDTLLAGGDSAGGRMLAVTDGERHREIRRIMLRSFSPRALRRVVEAVRRRTDDVVAAAVERGHVDAAADVADSLPMGTICDLMDVPEADRPHLLTMTKAAMAAEDEWGTELDTWTARNEILLYFADLAEHRRRAPGDDVVSALACATLDGRPLDDDELVLNCYSLILGGDESSRMSAIGAFVELARHPDQWAALRAGAVDVETATEELLRWATPAMHFARRVTRPVELGGRLAAPGDVVTLWNTSANRDETVFPEPGVLDLARTPNKHLAFGHGAHYCLGAFLGRAELAAVVSSLRDRVGAVELTAEPERVYSNFLFGYSTAPVRLSPA